MLRELVDQLHCNKICLHYIINNVVGALYAKLSNEGSGWVCAFTQFPRPQQTRDKGN